MRRDLKPQSSFAPSEPLGAEEFDAAMANFGPLPSSAALAISGGPDSMALAWCAKNWAEKNKCALKAFIIDHGLRISAAVEARDTQKQLSSLGIAADILRWEHPPVISRLHATARRARYELLAEACRRNGICDLLLAHQKEDQAETILMRFAKGSGVDGLAGMSQQSDYEGIRLLRPLLGFSKERLVATCRSARLSFVIDPSNTAEKFARGRLRKIMPLLADEGFTVERLIDLGERAGEVSEALDHYTEALLRVATSCDMFGVIRFDLEQLRAAPAAVAERAVGTCLQSIHREEYLPERAPLNRLLSFLCSDEAMQSRTLNGNLISQNASHAVFMREPLDITETSCIKAGERRVWDKRWEITLGESVTGNYIIRPLGNPPYEILDALAPGLRHRLPQGRARASLPSLWRNDVLALIPDFHGGSEEMPAAARLLTLWPPRQKPDKHL